MLHRPVGGAPAYLPQLWGWGSAPKGLVQAFWPGLGGGDASPPHPQRFFGGVCFARVTCLIISFSGGRLFLVSTVTAPLRGEAIRQRVKQVIKTLKPMCTEGGRVGGKGAQ